MVPSPKTELLHEFNPRDITETCRSRFTLIIGLRFFDFFLMAEFSESEVKYIPEKSLNREHEGPLICI